MKNKLFAGVVSILVLALSSAGSLGQQPENLQWIRVEGNRFVNESGEPVIFQGVSIRDPHNLEQDERWDRTLFREAADWGSDLVRLPIHPRSWRERGAEEYLGLIDQAVEWARDLKMYLILDWHSIGNLKEEKFQHEMYVTSMEETLEFWDRVSERYSGEPVVAMYELYNEPAVSGDRFGEMTWPEWKEMNEKMIRVVRKNHPRSVILVAGFDWAYDLTMAGNNPVDAPGIAYVSHPYPEKRKAPWEAKWENDWGFMAENYPVILTEIGFALPDEPGVHVPVHGDETYGRALVDFTAERGISWVAWCFDPKWSPYMFTDWNFTPTRQGKFFREIMTRK